MHVRKHLKLHHPLIQKHVDGITLVVHHEPEIACQLLFIGLTELLMNHISQRKKGNH